ncbi:hypothetical protein MSIMFB_01313 [Mycobacterium simulans]|uniref:TIGR02453 family protein n=1 Tax=Mycobacterium simulans TaxID=627089 RepID=A0A7Z7IJR7_9MYCO|nr:DUF2461 family protein [Mycobacterium simulans]SOJ53816.1 hypothetical protein MSIMFB_01313 [Mycobacterium simulans]
MTFNGFPPDGLALLACLPTLDSASFAAERGNWEQNLLDPARNIVADLGAWLAKHVSPGLVAVPKVNGSIAPIHRDLRFNPHGPHYKDHLLFRWWEGIPKKTAPTLFLRLDPDRIGFASGVTFASTDRWRAVVGDTRTAAGLCQLINDIRRDTSDVDIAGADLKRVPAPFSSEHPGANLLRHKTMFQLRWAEELPADVSTHRLVAFSAARLARLADLHRWLVANIGV